MAKLRRAGASFAAFDQSQCIHKLRGCVADQPQHVRREKGEQRRWCRCAEPTLAAPPCEWFNCFVAKYQMSHYERKNHPIHIMNQPGRNDPCPCGSGKKFKKCCLPAEQAARPRTMIPPSDEDFLVELRPDLDDAVDRLLQQMEQGAGRRVERELVAMFEKNPEYHMTNYALGVYRAMILKDPKGAIPLFERAVKIFPPFPEAHFNLGNTARQSFDIPKAVAAYRKAERYSQDEDGIAAMARKELEFLEKMLLKTTSFTSLDAYVANAQLFDDAFECLQEQQFEQAIKLFQRVLSENPGHVQSYGNMALAHAGLGQKSAALACLERALELDPGYQPARDNLRVIAQMQEGEPNIPGGILEVEFYADKLRKET
jgi:hypothetical protein